MRVISRISSGIGALALALAVPKVSHELNRIQGNLPEQVRPLEEFNDTFPYIKYFDGDNNDVIDREEAHTYVQEAASSGLKSLYDLRHDAYRISGLYKNQNIGTSMSNLDRELEIEILNRIGLIKASQLRRINKLKAKEKDPHATDLGKMLITK